MNATQDISDWAEAEARFQRAKQALLDAQQQHLAAAEELLLARARMRQLLEAIFPGAEGVSCPSISKLRLETRGENRYVHQTGKGRVGDVKSHRKPSGAGTCRGAGSAAGC